MRSQEHIHNNMSAVRASDSKIEQKLAKALWNANFRYRKQYSKLPGKPDFVLIKQKIAIFCDSHFWHGYKWKKKEFEHKKNKQFWRKKIERTIQRDREVNQELKRREWKVIRFWEHEIKENIEKCIRKVKEEIKK
tara:strand:- start:2123 stop:2527 length:405 start_codon:yes stop_codon:yes gene_type:complete